VTERDKQVLLERESLNVTSNEDSDQEVGESYEYTFTVVTATHNESQTLHRVFESLVAQTDQDFEWLIVDNGSTDNTRQLVEQWRRSAPFYICYLYQGDRSQAPAFNLAIKEAQGEFLIYLGAEDACIPTALERLRYHWNTIPLEARSRFSGIHCHCQDVRGNLIGSMFPAHPLDATAAEMRYRHKVTGEKWGMQRTDVLRQFAFSEPLEGNVGFLPESIVRSKLMQHYSARYVNECLRIYYEECAAAHLTKVKPRINPIELNLLSRSTLECDLDYFWWSPLVFFIAAVNYSRSHFQLKTPLWKQWVELESGWGRGLWLALLPIGFLLAMKEGDGGVAQLNDNSSVGKRDRGDGEKTI
jgi:glycosyltransferase involved in cell wall biosynthesis